MKIRSPAGTLTKVIESGGISSQMNLVKSNQFPKETCLSIDCLPCFQKGGSKSQCLKNNIGYEGQCSRCEERTVYIGKTAYTRIKQHFSNYKVAANAKLPAIPNQRQADNNNVGKRDVKSWMWEHTRYVHGGVVGDLDGKCDFMMKVTGRFRKCLERQVNEGYLSKYVRMGVENC